MAYENFKRLVWSKNIQHQLPKFTVFEPDCNYQFKGEIKFAKQVKILGVNRPTIGTYTGSSIGTPETVPTSAQFLDIDQAKFFNFMVDDVDEAQSTPGLMESLMEESTRAMAQERDSYIAKICAESAGYNASAVEIDTAAEAKAALQAALVWLLENGINPTVDKVTAYLTPEVYTNLAEAMISDKTANDQLVGKGDIGRYLGIRIKLSNNLYKDSSNYFHNIVKTDKACAFASAIDDVEAYRPESLFSDAIKGLNVYGGKVVRPQECYAFKSY